MDLRHLRCFVAVMEMGSLSKAAGMLSVSQPSLSQQIASMEYDLGVPLLLRSPPACGPRKPG